MNSIIYVGLGGAVGAIGRYMLSLLPIKTVFPLITLSTNLTGSLLIGFIAGLSMKKSLQGNWLLFWKTGVCGGFTTFSTFSLEALNLFETRQYLCGGFYVILSVAFCILGAALGQYAAFRLGNI